MAAPSNNVAVKVEMREDRILRAAARASRGNLSAAAYVIAQRAKDKIKRRRTESMPGEPPTTRRGLLRRAIQYAVDKRRLEAVIGPAASKVGTSGQAHEFGGIYKKQRYPQRPFMGPTLEEQADVIPRLWEGTI